jgi:hypothetical protein
MAIWRGLDGLISPGAGMALDIAAHLRVLRDQAEAENPARREGDGRSEPPEAEQRRPDRERKQ